MIYTVTFRIHPSGPFGLPQDGTVVVPGDLGQFHGPTIDMATGLVAGHGTLPIYRTESNSVSLTLSLPTASARIHDNYLFMTVAADTPKQALLDALTGAGLLMRLVGADRGELFYAKVESVVDESPKAHPLPAILPMGSFTLYDTGHLSRQFQVAAESCANCDDRLRKALLYFQNAAWLFGQYLKPASQLTTAAFSIASLAVLELWKACSAIVGDPSVRKDCYQRRYRTIGIDNSLKDRIDDLKSLRNDYDVAHYSLEPEVQQTLQGKLPGAFATAQDTIKAYIRYLRASNRLDKTDIGDER
jgi:hypothetical protein